MSGELFVDPEGLIRLGQQYRYRAQLFRSYVAALRSLRNTYWNSWGTDDLGQKFSEKFVAGLLTLEGILGSAADTLDYTAEGLELSGKTFRGADDDAEFTSTKLRTILDDLPNRPGPSANHSGEGDGERGQHRHPEGMKLGVLRPTLASLVTVDEPAYATLTSSFSTPVSPGGGEVLIDGVPLDDRYLLMCFREIEPGTVRVNVNHYQSITPLGPRTEVQLGGTPFNPDPGQQMFLVQRHPGESDAYDPSAPRTYVNFYSDGSSEPYGTAQG